MGTDRVRKMSTMKRIRIAALVAGFAVILLGMQMADNTLVEVPQTLKGTNWQSQFYHYQNRYHFVTDSTGFAVAGQFAWGCPVDTTRLGISGEDILYTTPQAFMYHIVDRVLKISYQADNAADREASADIFHYRPARGDWIADHEYAYGRECLSQVNLGEGTE